MTAMENSGASGSPARCGNREALPLDRLWKAEQIGGGKAISSKPLARHALRGWCRETIGESDTLALIGGSRYDSGRYDGLRLQA